MAVYSRPDSPWWWLYLENAPPGHRKEKTSVRVGTTAAARRRSRRLAEQVYAKRVTDHAKRVHRLPQTHENATFTLIADIYERDVVPNHKGKARELQILATLRRDFSREPIDAIDRERVQQWMTERTNAVSTRTVNREVDVLKAVLAVAVPKYLETNPLAGLRRLPVVEPRRRLMSPAEEQRLLAVCTPVDAALIILGLDTLQRLGDLLKLKRSDRDGQWIYIADPKNGRPLDVPLSPRAAAALDAIPEAKSPYYFHRFQKNKNPGGCWRARLKALCGKADVKYGRVVGFTFHWATRRTGLTRYLIDKHVPVPVAQRLGNWKHPDVVLKVYAEAQRSDLAQAVGQSFPTRSRSRAKAR